jgi:hypothetical protein
MSQPTIVTPALARDVATRATAAVGLAGIALIHLLDSVDTWSETRYLFWMYVALMVACVVLAGAVLHAPGRAVWLAVGGLAVLVIAGYVLSRTTGLPDADDDVGNWTEPLGLASLFVEGCVVAVSAYGLSASARAAGTARDARRTAAERPVGPAGRERASAGTTSARG